MIHDSLENASERGSGSGNRFGNLFAPSHSVQLLSLAGIRNCVKLCVNNRSFFLFLEILFFRNFVSLFLQRIFRMFFSESKMWNYYIYCDMQCIEFSLK